MLIFLFESFKELLMCDVISNQQPNSNRWINQQIKYSKQQIDEIQSTDLNQAIELIKTLNKEPQISNESLILSEDIQLSQKKIKDPSFNDEGVIKPKMKPSCNSVTKINKDKKLYTSSDEETIKPKAKPTENIPPIKLKKEKQIDNETDEEIQLNKKHINDKKLENKKHKIFTSESDEDHASTIYKFPIKQKEEKKNKKSPIFTSESDEDYASTIYKFPIKQKEGKKNKNSLFDSESDEDNVSPRYKHVTNEPEIKGHKKTKTK
jgi:hypothetical protein